MRHSVNRLVANALCLVSCFAVAQTSKPSANAPLSVRHDSTLGFVLRDKTCIYGTVEHADANSITLAEAQNKEVTIEAERVLQVRQDDAVVLSARSSWSDVADVHLYPHESLVIKLRNGKSIKSTSFAVAGETITSNNLSRKRVFQKAEIATVDYVRVKPESDGFDYLLQEAPLMLIFNGEFYSRLLGLQGKIVVRLYDSEKPEDDSPIMCVKS